MNSSFRLQRLTNLLRTRSNLFSIQTILQIHAQLTTTGLYLNPSSHLSLLNLSLSNPSILHYATTVFTHIQPPNKPTWRVLIWELDLDNDPFRVIHLFNVIQRVKQNDPIDDPYVFASLIKACNKLFAFREVKSIHCYVVRFGLDCNVNILNSLIYCYSSLAKLMNNACLLFDRMPQRTISTVNCMLSGFLKNKQPDAGVGLFIRMLNWSFDVGLKPNYVSLVILISGCVEFAAFSIGLSLHSYCWKMGLALIIEVGNVLIDFYAKFGYMDDASRMFNGMSLKDLISWNTMMAGYARSNDCTKAYSLYSEMRTMNIGCDRVSLISLLMASANSRDLSTGKVIHGYTKTSGMAISIPLGTALINLYSKCENPEFAKKVFSELPDEDIEYWNSMINGYVECGKNCEALELFSFLKSRNVKPDEVTLLGLISACRSSGKLHYGIDIHSYMESSDDLNGNISLNNALIDMYAKCGSMTRARTVFDKMPKKDVISWTSIIVGHAINGEAELALLAFWHMRAEKVEPNSITFIGVLSACEHAGMVNEGRHLYDIMCRVYHIEPGIEHCGCMVDLYARAGMLDEAYKFVKNMTIEPNAIIWRMLISACRVHGNLGLGLRLVSELKIKQKKVHDAEDHVTSSNIFAEAGRWNEVLQERSLMVTHKSLKVAGKTSINSWTE